MLEDIAQYGIAAMAMAVLYYFIKVQEKKDQEMMEHISRQEENFVEVVKNHLSHNTTALEKLTEIMKEVRILLRRNNNRK